MSVAALQLSGLHMHVDEGGYVGVPEGPHTHSHFGNQRGGTGDHDGAADHHHSRGSAGVAVQEHDGEQPADHDYGDAKDVSLLELSGGAAKLLLALILLTLFVPLLTRAGHHGFVPHFVRPLGSRRSRWRPPLRAPPLSA